MKREIYKTFWKLPQGLLPLLLLILLLGAAGCAPAAVPAIPIPAVPTLAPKPAVVHPPPAPPAPVESRPIGLLSPIARDVEHGPAGAAPIPVEDPVDLQANDSVAVRHGGEALLDFGSRLRMRLFNDTDLDVTKASAASEIPLEIFFFLEQGGFTGELTGPGDRVTYSTPNEATILILGTAYFVIHDPETGITWVGNFGGTVIVDNGAVSISLEDQMLIPVPGGEPRPIPFTREELEARGRANGSLHLALQDLLAAETDRILVAEPACTTTGNVFLLTGPGGTAAYALVGSLTPGHTVTVLGGNDRGGAHSRYKVRTADGMEGWLVAEYCPLLAPADIPWTSYPPPFTPRPTVIPDPPTPTATATAAPAPTKVPTLPPTPVPPTPVPPTATWTPTAEPIEVLQADLTVSWALSPENPLEAIATVNIYPSGGRDGYRYFRDGIEQPGPTFSYPWSACAANPVSFKVVSGDGQSVVIDRYEEPPCPPPPNQPPVAFIESPYSGQGIQLSFYDDNLGLSYADVPLIGVGNDEEDGALPADAFVWTTDLAGVPGGYLGQGKSITGRLYAKPCSVQDVLIRLTVTDSAGAQATVEVWINLFSYCVD